MTVLLHNRKWLIKNVYCDNIPIPVWCSVYVALEMISYDDKRYVL